MSQRYADAYRSILPPDSLREKVLSTSDVPATQNNKGRIVMFRRFACLAACLAVVAAGVFVSGQKPQLQVNNEILSSVPAAASVPFAARRSMTQPVGLVLTTDSRTELSVQGGTMNIFSTDTQLLFENVTQCEVDADCIILLQPDAANNTVLQVNGRGLPATYTLFADENGNYTLTRE